MRQKYRIAAAGLVLAFFLGGCSNKPAVTPASKRMSYYGDPSRMPQAVKTQIATGEQRAALITAQQRAIDIAKVRARAQTPPK